MTYLDTHVAIWLYIPRLDLLSDRAREVIDDHALLVSPMVRLELAFLNEVGRLRVSAGELLESLGRQLGLALCDLDFRQTVDSAAALSWTRDPFDRVIVGHAAAANGQLVTRDETIRANFARAVW